MKHNQIIAVLLALVLGGCANAIKPENLPQQRIVDVQVTVNSNSGAQSDIRSKVAASSLQAAAAYNAYMPANAPQRVLRINVDTVHYKNPLASFLVGDAHYAKGVVSGGAVGPSSITYVDAGSGVINGVAGAIIAAATDKGRVDARLAHGLAGKALAKAYGQNSVPRFVSDHLAGKPSASPSVAHKQVIAEQPVAVQHENVVVPEQVEDPVVEMPTYNGPTAPRAVSNS